ncbi:response regulator transcription factor [Homoserinibacter gongjuensis]|jgi:DNA-binding NarL/FixJ family response regulator|uniref:DNA-binding response regulator n=1 Tax=Homoserinibacter gongjuensis TaxID=1162968 RepID=A0ABQ6JQK9_9MICO|nr:response regulator transcription factor [Homoserinibacter gongjuensis]GMA90581.1 DNA-binding response regulator [Homoserinibacter gongjuensis]
MTEIRVAVADDHPVFREGLAVLLGSLPGVEVVGTAADGEEAVALAEKLRPDVIVMDVQMPGLDGIAATERIRTSAPEVGVVVVTMSEDEDTLFFAMRAGARGYLLKGASQDDISRAIRSVAAGDVVFGPNVAQRVARHFADDPSRGRATRRFPQLTEREGEVLALLAEDLSNQQIAQRLYISAKTARNYVSAVLTKLQVLSRAEAAELAREAGL